MWWKGRGRGLYSIIFDDKISRWYYFVFVSIFLSSSLSWLSVWIFTLQFQNLTNLSEGEIAHFEASLIPIGDQTMIVEWFFNGKPIEASAYWYQYNFCISEDKEYAYKIIFTGHRIRTVHAFGMVVLEILGTVIKDTGTYTCRATNKWGKAEISVNLECVERTGGQRPQFTSQLKVDTIKEAYVGNGTFLLKSSVNASFFLSNNRAFPDWKMVTRLISNAPWYRWMIKISKSNGFTTVSRCIIRTVWRWCPISVSL